MLYQTRMTFTNLSRVGLSHARKRKMVTFGIKPTHLEAGYGYLELSENPLDAEEHLILKLY